MVSIRLLALGFLALQIGTRRMPRVNWAVISRSITRVQASSSDGNDVQRSVDLAVAATVEVMAVASPRGCRYRSDARHPGGGEEEAAALLDEYHARRRQEAAGRQQRRERAMV